MFGIKMVDRLILPQIENFQFVGKLDIFTKIALKSYMSSKMHTLMKVINDMKIPLKESLQYLLAQVFRITNGIFTGEKMDIHMRLKKVLDHLVIPENEYTKFILKTLQNLMTLSSALQLSKQYASFYLRQYIDSLINVDPDIIMFLIGSKMISKNQMSAYISSKYKFMAKKVRDQMIDIQLVGNFLLKALKRTKANFSFKSQAEIKTYFTKMVDQMVHVNPPIIKFLTQAFLRMSKGLMETYKVINMKFVLKKFKDELIQVEEPVSYTHLTLPTTPYV